MHEELIVGKIIVVTLGFVIAYQAYRGYRRNGSEPMLYLALGFAIISVGSVIEGVLFELWNHEIFLAGAVQTVISAVGMLLVLYSLYGRHGSTIHRETFTDTD